MKTADGTEKTSGSEPDAKINPAAYVSGTDFSLL
jgi:hypothetical protein